MHLVQSVLCSRFIYKTIMTDICTPTVLSVVVCGSFTFRGEHRLGVLWNRVLREIMFIEPCIIAIVDEWKTNLMSLAILFHLLCAQHVSDINISIFRSLRLCWWITSVILFSVRCVWELLLRLVFGGVRFAGWSRLLKMDILMSETCWAHNNWNKITRDIKLVFHSSTIAMMHGPINIRFYMNVRKAASEVCSAGSTGTRHT